jgi:hypothetical protein
MKRFVAVAAIAVLALSALTLSGCSSSAKAEGGGMALPKVWGYVAAEKNAQLDVADQLGVDKLVVKRVLAPADAWIVVHADDNGMPGERVGLAHVSKGESLNVEVPLKGVKTEKVIVAIHADKGTPGEFDFDMMKKLESPDRPFFVNEKELAKIVAVREFGVKADSGTAAIEASAQPGASGTLTIDRAVAPGPAWVVVHLNDNGMPGKRIGYAPIVAGENRSVTVSLSPDIALTPEVLVAIHADRGVLGTLEFDMMDKVNSPDQPYFVDGQEVATKVSVK